MILNFNDIGRGIRGMRESKTRRGKLRYKSINEQLVNGKEISGEAGNMKNVVEGTT